MTKVLLLVSLFAISILAGCGGDDATDEEAAPPANFVSAAPPSGSEIAVNGSITLTFDNAPADARASTGVSTAVGKMVTVPGPFTPGPLRLTITWADGTQTLTYTVVPPD